jgi:hypothetical protein
MALHASWAHSASRESAIRLRVRRGLNFFLCAFRVILAYLPA